MKKKFQILFAPEGEGGGGSGEPPVHKPTATEVINRYSGDQIRMAEQIAKLEGEAYIAREKARDQDRIVTDLKAKVPADGTKVLSPAEAKSWDAYQEFGKPEELKTTLDTGKAAIAERDAFKKAATIESAAKAANFKPGVLKILGKDLDIEIKEIDVQTEDGATAKKPMAFVKTKDSAGVESEKALRDYFKEQGEDVLGSLEAGESENDNGSGTHSTAMPFPAQTAGGGQAKSTFASLGARRYAHNEPKVESK